MIMVGHESTTPQHVTLETYFWGGLLIPLKKAVDLLCQLPADSYASKPTIISPPPPCTFLLEQENLFINLLSEVDLHLNTCLPCYAHLNDVPGSSNCLNSTYRPWGSEPPNPCVLYFWFAITPAPSASLPNSRLEDEVAPAAPSRFPISGGVQITQMNILVDYIYILPQQSQNTALWRSLDLMCVFWSAGLCAYVLQLYAQIVSPCCLLPRCL